MVSFVMVLPQIEVLRNYEKVEGEVSK